MQFGTSEDYVDDWEGRERIAKYRLRRKGELESK